MTKTYYLQSMNYVNKKKHAERCHMFNALTTQATHALTTSNFPQ